MAEESFGIQMFIGPIGSEATTKIGSLITINLPELMREAVDVTSHDSANGASEFIPDGVFSTGAITGSVNYTATDAGIAAIIAAVRDGVKRTFKIVDGAVVTTGTAVVTKFKQDDRPLKGKKTASFEMQPDADWTQA